MIFIALGILPTAWSQPGSLDASFKPSNAGGQILRLQSNGQILTCTLNSSITRLNVDGTLDTNFPPIYSLLSEQSGLPYNIEVQKDDRILVGVEFYVTPRTKAGIVRLTPDEVLDPTFQLTQVNGFINGIKSQPDGGVLFFGNISFDDSPTVNQLARLRPDGSLDESFSAASANGTLSAWALQTDGKILIGGAYTQLNGAEHFSLTRLNTDGSVDGTFNTSSNLARIYDLGVQADGGIVAIVLAGTGTNLTHAIVRLMPDGTLDANFQAPSLAWLPENYDERHCVAIQKDGRIVIGLDASKSGADIMPSNIIFRLLSDGNVDSTFHPNWVPQAGPSKVNSLLIQTNGQIIIDGSFPIDKTLQMWSLARLNGDDAPVISNHPTNQTVALGGAANFSVLATGPKPLFYQWQKDAQNLAGQTNAALSLSNIQASDVGAYTVLVSNPVGAVRSESAQLSLTGPMPAGTIDNSFNATLPIATSANVKSIILLKTNGNIVISGRLMGPYSGQINSDLWEVDSQGTYVKLIAGFSSIPSYTAQPDGKILASYMEEFQINNPIIRLNADGSGDSTFTQPGCGPFTTQCGFIYDVDCMGVQHDGKIVTGGRFTSYTGDTRFARLARLNADGTLDENFHVGRNSIVSVNKMIVQPDDRILILGDFTQVDGLARTNLARLNADGTIDASFDAGNTAINGDIRTFVLDSSQRIMIGGDFTQIQVATRNHIARLLPNGQLDASFDPGIGPDNWVSCLALQSDGKVWLAGGFTNVDGFFSSHIARLNPDGSRDTKFYPGTGANSGHPSTDDLYYYYSLRIQPNGDALFGGSFTSFNGVPCNGLVRIHGDPVLPALRLTEPGLVEGKFSFNLQGIDGTRYAVQTSTNLVDWQTVTNGQQTGPSMLWTNPVPDNVAHLYYRVKSE